MGEAASGTPEAPRQLLRSTSHHGGNGIPLARLEAMLGAGNGKNSTDLTPEISNDGRDTARF